MALKKHPRSADFLKWLNRNKKQAMTLDGDFFRVAGPRHTTASEIVSGIGAQKAGGRWNPIGEMRVVYLSREPETALSEALEHFRYYHLPESSGLPKVVVSVKVKLDLVLDLGRSDLRGQIPELIAELMAEDWRALNARSIESASQAVGRAAYTAGLQGLIVPSKPVPKGSNLLVFPESLPNRSCLTVENPEELDKLGKRA